MRDLNCKFVMFCFRKSYSENTCRFGSFKQTTKCKLHLLPCCIGWSFLGVVDAVVLSYSNLCNSTLTFRFSLTFLKPFPYAGRKYKYFSQNFGFNNLVRSSITHLVKQFKNGTVVHHSFAYTYLEYIFIEFNLHFLIH